MDDKTLSQVESKLVADYLRRKGKVISSSALLWRKRPSEIGKIYDVKAEEVFKAAGRAELAKAG